MAAYGRLVWARAVAETQGRLSLSGGFIVRTLLVQIVGVWLAWFLGTWDNAVNTAMSVFVGVVLANVVVILATMMIQVARSPALIHADQQQHIKQIMTQLAIFDRTQD